MDQADFGYDDFIEKSPKGGKRKPLILVFVAALVILLLGIGGYAVLSRPDLLSALAQLRPAAGEEADPTPAPTDPATQVAGMMATDQPEPTATEPQPTEAPVEVAAPEAILPTPEFGWLVDTRANGSPEHEEYALKSASNMAIREPYQWEYLEFDQATLAKDVERYYIQLLNKDLGYLMTFNERYPSSGLAVFKFKQDGRRVTIEFIEGQKDRTPAAFLFYEGW